MAKIDSILRINPLLFDGAMGTELQKKGLPANYPAELWNIENPETVAEIHSAYAAAGSVIITANSIGANRKRFEFAGYNTDIYKLNKTAASLVKSAAGNKKYAAGSVGPSGLPADAVSETELREIYYEQITGLIAGGIDIILIETMLTAYEAKQAVYSAKSAGAESIGVSFTFENHNGNFYTPYGDELGYVIKEMEQTGVDFIGSNCGNGFVAMKDIAVLFREKTKLPVIIQPNAGIPIIENGRYIYKETKEMFADFAVFARDLGIEFIGGCCGTGPEYIKEAADALKS
jgi:5-methyltetrahydrofolate--homocysteine methyltransferase